MSEFPEIKAKYSALADEIVNLAKKLNIESARKKAVAFKARVNDDIFRLVVVGEFNRGKSTILNALLGAEILPAGEQETTATINILKYGEIPKFRIIYSNGAVKEEKYDPSMLWQFTALKDFDPGSIKQIELFYPSEYLKNGIEIIDTPGVNDPNEHRMEITYEFIPMADATLFVLDAGAAFTLSEKLFLTEHVLSNNIGSLLYVLNRADEIDPAKIESQIRNASKKISEATGNLSPEVIPLSARLALEGTLEANENKLEKSFFVGFSERLKLFLLGDERLSSRILGFQCQSNALLNELSDCIVLNKKDLHKSIAELVSLKEGIVLSEKGLHEKFEEIMHYIDTDQESLNTKIETSLLKRFGELNESLSVEIQSYHGDLNDYAKVTLPFRIKNYLKGWLESNSEPIETMQKFSLINASEAFEKYFSKKVILTGLYKTIETDVPSGEINFGLNDDSNTEAYSQYAFGAGALLLGGLALATGGLSLALVPSVIGGGFAGRNLFSQFFAKNVIEKQKQELFSVVPNALRMEFDAVLTEARVHLTEFYSSLRSSLQQEFNVRLSEIKQEIDSKISNYQKDQSIKNEMVSALDSGLARIEELRKKI
jgi:GTPase SAR1 family protein